MIAKKHITVFAFVMLNVATVLNLKGLPLIAKTNATMISYLLFSIIFFLPPCSFVAAELSSTFSKPGGIYHWIKTAFGPRLVCWQYGCNGCKILFGFLLF